MASREVNLPACIAALERFPAMLRAAVAGLAPEEARRRGPKDAWSILEIVNHLADEEVDDFPRRLRLILEDPKHDWPPIDPEGWAMQRDYQSRDLAESLERFERQRRESVKWLRSLGSEAKSAARGDAGPPRAHSSSHSPGRATGSTSRSPNSSSSGGTSGPHTRCDSFSSQSRFTSRPL